MDNEERITYFAETDTRNKRIPFGIKAKDRTKHVYVIGKTGMGKSTLLENMAIQDIQNGEGLAFIDPHGKTADLLLEYVPKERLKDVIVFAPFDTEFPIAFNVMEDVGVHKRHLVTSGLISSFKKIWGPDTWSARMEYILSNTLMALLEYPDSTLMGVNKMLSDKEFRKKVVENIQDVSVRSFWVDEFAKYTERFAAEATPAIQNKIGQFTSNPLIRNIIGQPKSSFDIRKVMDEKKILIINLSKGRVGEQNANLLGSMLITKIYLAAMSRADTHETQLKKLPNFYLYVDEFQSFANESFADILSEARKYKLNLTIAHQYIEQMEEEVRDAVFGNVGTMITFRVGAFDAEVLQKEFAPGFTATDLVNLGFIQIYLKLMIDGVTSAPFSALTLPPIKKPQISFVPELMAESRDAYAHPKEEVEKLIRELHGSVHPPLVATKPVTPVTFDRRKDDQPASVHQEKETHVAKKTENPFQSIKIEQVENKPTKIITEAGARQTISLSSLKRDTEKDKEPLNSAKKKEGSAENVQALRDVLSGLLKQRPEEKPQEKSLETKEEHKETRQEERLEGEIKEETKKETKSEPRKVETLHEIHQRKAHHIPQSPHEVPEEVLKNILKIE